MSSVRTQEKTVAQTRRSRILIYSAGGYNFGEYFKPVIEALLNDADIRVLQGDSHLTKITKAALEELAHANPRFSYEIVHVFDDGESVIRFHKYVHELINRLQEESFDLLVLSSDFYPVDRYLIRLARSRGSKILIQHANTMPLSILDAYRRVTGLDVQKTFVHKIKQGLAGRKNIKEKLRFIQQYVYQRVKARLIICRKIYYRVQHYYVFPWLFSRVVFPKSPCDKFAFTSGRGDAVVCFDPEDAEALKAVIPAVKNIYVCRHPSACYARSAQDNTAKKLLVLVSRYMKDIPDGHVLSWVNRVKQIVSQTRLDEIHLRFHPRTNREFQGVKKIISMVKAYGVKVVIHDVDEQSLAELAGDYIGILGTVSGSLRTARYASSGFVIGLVKEEETFIGDTWMLGSAEGITWIHEGEDIEAKHLIIPQLIGEDRPRVEEIVRNLCGIGAPV